MHSRTCTKFAAIFLALLASGATAAQPPAGETKAEKPKEAPPVDLRALFRMHYENRVRSFREQNLAYRNVVLLGDSITEGFEVPKYFPGRRVINRGIGGDVIGNGLPEDDARGVLRRLDSSLFDCAATDVFLMIGINDLNSGHPVDGMVEGYREILTKIKERDPAVRVHIQSLLPTGGQYAGHNEAVRQFNRKLRELAEEFHVHYIDLHSKFAGPDGELKAEFTGDGLHLTEPGYREWLEVVEEVMGWTRR